jgi:glutamate--cysteine ligase
MEGGSALYLPHATSLRMGRLGYQSDAQATLAVSYNGLTGYANSLHEALTKPYPAYETIGVRNPGGDYNQLGTSLLQIENEFYGTIRPKRTVRTGERPLHALRERGVEYVEVRLMDLDPFVPVGITASTMRLLDVFLLHCLLSDSPPDTPAEIAELKQNQHLTAERGREPGLRLSRNGQSVLLTEWGSEVLAACAPLADALDAQHGTHGYSDALRDARALMAAPERTPSARVLDSIVQSHHHSFESFARQQSVAARDALLSLPWTAEQQARYLAMADESIAAQKAIEAADTLPFEEWRERYMAVKELG